MLGLDREMDVGQSKDGWGEGDSIGQIPTVRDTNDINRAEGIGKEHE